MPRSVMLAFALLTAFAAPLRAQGPVPEIAAPAAVPDAAVPPTPDPAAPPAAPRTMVGSWEFSNADREKTCTVTFRNDATKVGKRVEFDAACAGHFPFIREIAGWRHSDNDFLRLVDAQGDPVLEFSEVESGIFEAPRPGEGILFIQNASALGPAPKTATEMTGNWQIVRRTGRPICSLTLTSTAAGEEFVIRVQPPCEPFVARFAPATWQMDRGELVLRSANGQSWRFEESEGKWSRIPATSDPVLMVRK